MATHQICDLSEPSEHFSLLSHNGHSVACSAACGTNAQSPGEFAAMPSPMPQKARYISVPLLMLAASTGGSAATRYSVKTLGDVVQLRDAKTDIIVSVLTP